MKQKLATVIPITRRLSAVRPPTPSLQKKKEERFFIAILTNFPWRIRRLAASRSIEMNQLIIAQAELRGWKIFRIPHPGPNMGYQPQLMQGPMKDETLRRFLLQHAAILATVLPGIDDPQAVHLAVTDALIEAFDALEKD